MELSDGIPIMLSMPSVKKPPHQRRRTYLREWRKHRGYSQERVAEMLEVDQTTVSRLERGEVPYNQDILERLALVYGCEPYELITINPKLGSQPRLVWDAVNRAPEQKREAILSVIEALLKTGS